MTRSVHLEVMLQAAGGNILEKHPCWLSHFLLLSLSILLGTGLRTAGHQLEMPHLYPL